MKPTKPEKPKVPYFPIMCGLVLLTGNWLSAQSCQPCQCGVQCNADYTDCSCVPPPSCSGGGTATCSDTGWACPICTSNPTFICSCGQQVCQNGNWVCSSGTQCSIPPPAWSLSCTYGPECTGSGWQCKCSPGGCTNPDPIIIDAGDKGFHLTDVAHGVPFTFVPGQPPIRMAWTDARFGNGFLVLDRNGNGIIDDGTEFFGNLTPQPPSATPNGYLALAVFDNPANGGNGNGFIDPGDAVYGRLRVWIDANHNGISEPWELHTLTELGIMRIDLKYRYAHYVDRFGNEFRYRATVWDEVGKGRDVSYDVFFRIAADSATAGQSSRAAHRR